MIDHDNGEGNTMNFYTYRDFERMSNHLSLVESEAIYDKFLHSTTTLLVDESFKEYWEEFVLASVEYSEKRGKWLLTPMNERTESMDTYRTSKHERVILSLKIIKRYMEKNNLDIQCLDELGEDRKRIGDFACYISYIYSVNAR